MALNPYNLDESKKELINFQAMYELQTETQVVMQILVAKGICTREEIQEHRERVRNLPKYREMREALNSMNNEIDYWKENPEKYLQALMKAKMDGTIK